VSRNDVPDVLGENVRNEEVDVLRGVGLLSRICGVDATVVPRRGLAQNGFDLDAPESALKTDDYVVTITVSPRLGDGET